MKSVQTPVDALVSDARLLALYMVRTGLLPPESRIFDEIDGVCAQPAGGQPPNLSALGREVAQGVRAIEPTTLDDLRQPAPSHSTAARMISYLTPLVLAALTLTLTLYLAFQSSELHKADVALNEYQQLEKEKPEEKLYQAWKMFRFERVINITSAPFTQLDDYQHLVQDFRNLVERRAAILDLFAGAQVVNWLPPRELTYETSNGSTGAAKQTDYAASGNYAAMLDKAPAGAGIKQSGTPQAVNPKSGRADYLNAAKFESTSCLLPPPAKPAAKVGSQAAPTFEELNAYVQGIDCFVSSLKISLESYNYPLSVGIYQTRLKVHLLTTWLLPGLYGLLGACVFLLRDIVFIREGPKVRYQPRVINLLSLVLRIALGGLAGIIIGWFSVPGSFESRDAPLAITSIPFGLAFLAGFSIETLFTLLDRFNKAIADPLRRTDNSDVKATGK